ncbi:MAG: arsenate reductase [Porticoccaceae bacterium]|mgnify:FL=1|nr:arsenate reductase [Porticoccaceae bacterium]
MATLYGIHNCNKVKLALKWLKNAGVEYEFHDLRKDGIEYSTIDSWIQRRDWQTFLNRRGLTWKRLSAEKQQEVSKTNVANYLREQPTLIKRPVLDYKEALIVDFREESYSALFYGQSK